MDSAVRGEDGVGEFEEGVSPALEAFVESGGRCEEHREIPWCDHHAPTESLPHPLPPAQLKRKLREFSDVLALQAGPDSSSRSFESGFL
jgi:hypothetical protein